MSIMQNFTKNFDVSLGSPDTSTNSSGEKIEIIQPVIDPKVKTNNVSGELYLQIFFLLFIIILSFIAIEVSLNFLKKRTEKNKQFRWFHGLEYNLIQTGIFIIVFLALDHIISTSDFNTLIKDFSSLVFLTAIFGRIYILAMKVLTQLSHQIQATPIHKKPDFFKDKNLNILMYRTMQTIFSIIILAVILNIWGFKVSHIFTGFGLVGLAVSLAAQESLSNIIGGISLIMDNAFSEGDFIQIDDNNTLGIIYDIGYRSTKILTFNDEMIIIPNGELAKMVILNLSRPFETYRLAINFQISFRDDPLFVKKLMLERVTEIPEVLVQPSPDIFFSAIDKYTFTLRLKVSITTPKIRLTVTDKILSFMYVLFKENDITIQKPISTMEIVPEFPTNEKLEELKKSVKIDKTS